MGNAFLNYFKNLGLSIFGKLEASIKTFLSDFVVNDLGKLAVAAVQEVEVSLPGAADEAKKAAAKAAFVDAAKAAGHDLGTFSESLLNFVIETALQAVLSAAPALIAKV